MIRRRHPNTLFGDMASIGTAGIVSSAAILALQGWQLEVPSTVENQSPDNRPPQTEIAPPKPDSAQQAAASAIRVQQAQEL